MPLRPTFTSSYRWRPLAGAAVLLAAVSGAALFGPPPSSAAAAGATTAWHDGSFQLDADQVVSRSDIVLGQPNVNPTASMPLGNGSLGVAAWAANGFTAQLNRSDTMPDRKSPGQLTIPGLSVISHAADFAGRLDLTDGVLEESGGGMSMKAWVSTGADELIVDVTGADPTVAQTASINLWAGRHPTAAVSGTIGTLAETWVDQGEAGAGGQTFGSLASITADGRDVSAAVAGPTQVRVSFTPKRDGSFRVVVGSPAWHGGDAPKAAKKLLGNDAKAGAAALLNRQDKWWRDFWEHTGLIELNSADGSAAYLENLRTLYLYEEAASEKAGIYPGNQAGDADMFDWSQDRQTWTPSEYWLWNLRAEISANLSSGNDQLNTPIFDMYLDDLANIETWTRQQMGGLPGACVPEVMRFNGNGGDPGRGANSGCSEPGSPNWNALNITSGPELSVYLWQQYQATGDRAFLKRAFPFMEATAQFLLAYQQVGPDGLLHAVANAHETQWAVQDPTTDIAADRVLFPIIARAAAVVGDKPASDPLLDQFARALTQIPPYPRTNTPGHNQLLNPGYTQAETDAADATGTDMIAISYQPAASRQNGENIELEPLWPWNDISDQDGNLYTLEQRSYANRPNKGGNDWSFDALDAARLEQPAQVESNLISLTKGHQVYPNGFADLGSTVGYQPYMEQSAGVAAALDEALAQDYDGIIRFAPAWPADWDGSGTVYIQGNGKVDVQVEGGELVTAAIEAGSTGTLTVKNPWPGQFVQVVDGKKAGRTVVKPTSAALLRVPVTAGRSYLVERVSAPTAGRPFAAVTGSAPVGARHLGNVQIGLDPAGPPTTAVVGTVLGATNASYGLSQVDAASATTASDVDGLSARTATVVAGAGDLYFDIDDSVARTSGYHATFTVSYHDTGTGQIALQYDDGPADRTHLAGTIQLTGSDTWKTATITADGAYLGDLEAGGADFRLHSTAAFTVHSVAVSVTGPAVPTGTRFPPAPVVTTPKNGATVKLASAISGTAAPDATVTVGKGGSVLCTATADDHGAWSCAPSGGLTPGRQTITATATDPTGLTGPASAAVSFDASDVPPGTAVVGSVVGATNSSYGMSQDETPSPGFDGPTTASVIDGLSARTSTDSNIYFNVDDSIAHAGDYAVRFTVSYFDQGNGSFSVQYDDGSSDPYRSTAGIPLSGSNTWKTATVTASDVFFGGAQHSSADFRLRNGSGQVTVHSAVVSITGAGVPDATDFPPPVAITAPASGSVVTATPTVSGTAEPDATVTVAADGTAVCTATASDSGAWSCAPTTPLAGGAHTLTATSTDVTATPATSAPVPVTVGS
ncbi:Ig-like domain-containing protein [Rugosimonospora africana]|uniref:Bacterial Ig-like domain-containing protein n=1 Tax=Rugosimonospora africana TaxID=556532 RepID=A0A8J3QTU1_9ACTN|nr:Ig-like domain-containing protein [Rugosimonospora africana]GIH15563.1 hypothetical protein Raf01_37350 [Rugosimonospora africana]